MPVTPRPEPIPDDIRQEQVVSDRCYLLRRSPLMHQRGHLSLQRPPLALLVQRHFQSQSQVWREQDDAASVVSSGCLSET